MKTKLEQLRELLAAGSEQEEAESVWQELCDPSSETSLFLAEAKVVSDFPQGVDWTMLSADAGEVEDVASPIPPGYPSRATSTALRGGDKTELERVRDILVGYGEEAEVHPVSFEEKPRATGPSTGPTVEYDPAPRDLGPRFGPFIILRKLGRGGMGTVYLALNTRLDRREALKVPLLAGYPHLRERFLEEARAAARLHHRNLCHVYEVGEIDGTLYLTMLFVEGRPLGEAVTEYAAAPRRAVALVEKLARAMAVAHRAGVLHRDLKPANILLDAEGEPVIVDFGLAVRLDGNASRLTQVGDVIGTPWYMAPEQHAGALEDIGYPTDVYALGVLLYELLTGRRPFEGTRAELIQHKADARFVPPSQAHPGLDDRLDEVCRRALAADPRQRYGSMTEFADALAALLATAAPLEPVPPPADDAAPRTSPLPPSDPQIAAEVLKLLRTWGWEEALDRLDERIRITEDERERALLRLAAGMLRGQLGQHQEAIIHYREAARLPELEAWAAVGEAFVAYRQNDWLRAVALLDEAKTVGERDAAVTATAVHLRGAILYRQARDAEALPYLFRAAELYGPDHYGFGRVLDTLGMVYATRGDFALAYAFFQRSLEAKLRHDDRAGLALTYGQLGRLLLEWGDLDGAHTFFESDLGVCWSINDILGEAKMHNQLGQVELARGRPGRALDHLNESVTRAEAGGWTVAEAFARKDRALALLALGRSEEAETDARHAEELFRQKDFAEGMFHARRALAQVHGARGRRDEAERLLKQAANFFVGQAEHAEAAHTWLELARLQRRTGASALLASQALRQALDQAECSRRETIITAVERELAEVDSAELARRSYERARGRDIVEDVTSLTAARQETASVLFLELHNYGEFAREQDPHLVRRTLNQIWADLEPVLERHGLVVNQYLGDGFMAFARGDGHARRAVAAGLDIQAAVEEFNRPRRLLQMRLIEVRIGVSAGSVVFANVGTYRKIDFTAVGAATNEAARLQTAAEPGAVCVSAATWKEVADTFAVKEGAGRTVLLKGFGITTVWDVIGRLSDSTR
jgi:serine/threonine protein kinase/class 3 adenylate cyclase